MIKAIADDVYTCLRTRRIKVASDRPISVGVRFTGEAANIRCELRTSTREGKKRRDTFAIVDMLDFAGEHEQNLTFDAVSDSVRLARLYVFVLSPANIEIMDTTINQ
ncbi:MAG: hypothetical protein ACI8W8_004473 [Rhodothermales bacterium]